jgi:hypothetical protein
MQRRFALAWLAAGACGCASQPATAPLLPAALPAPAVAYQDFDRSFVAPAGGRLSQREGDTIVDWPAGAELMVSVLPPVHGDVPDESVAQALQHIGELKDRPLMKEDAPGALVLCVESAPPAHAAACARVDAESRRGGSIVLTTFVAPAPVYAAMGGARVAAEAARAARAADRGGRLPPP